MTIYLGIDIAKDTFATALLRDGQSIEQGEFPNTSAGFKRLHNFLKKRLKKDTLHACLEATGYYGDELAHFLVENGYLVSIMNPARIKSYADSLLSRTKTDATDAVIIADFCRTQQPQAWVPPAPEIRELRAMVRHVVALTELRQQEVNRSQAGIPSQEVIQTIEEHIRFLDQQIIDLKKRINNHIDRFPDLQHQHDLLITIPGIAEWTAARLLAELPPVAQFETAKQVVAFAGLSPAQRQSGTSVRGRSHLSKRGSSRLRSCLFLPAIVAKKHNPVFAAIAARLAQAGKAKMVVIGALMRKLLVLAFTLLKSKRPFDPEFAGSSSFTS